MYVYACVHTCPRVHSRLCTSTMTTFVHLHNCPQSLCARSPVFIIVVFTEACVCVRAGLCARPLILQLIWYHKEFGITLLVVHYNLYHGSHTHQGHWHQQYTTKTHRCIDTVQYRYCTGNCPILSKQTTQMGEYGRSKLLATLTDANGEVIILTKNTLSCRFSHCNYSSYVYLAAWGDSTRHGLHIVVCNTSVSQQNIHRIVPCKYRNIL